MTDPALMDAHCDHGNYWDDCPECDEWCRQFFCDLFGEGDDD